MIIGIIKNKDNSYEYIFEKNNKLSFIHIGVDGFNNSNKNYIYSVFSFLFNKARYNFLGQNDNYQLYYDKSTNLYHFIKDRKEDYNLFFDNNGESAILYEGSNEKNSSVKKIFIAGLGISLILNIGIINYLYNLTFNDYYSSVEEVSVVNDYFDYNDAVRLINNSNIDADLKQYLCNEELLSDIFSYYNESAMKNKTIMGLENIDIVYYNSLDTDKAGYYNSTYPNRIYISDKYKNLDGGRRIIAHEFIHILQDQNCQYNYILESIDELIMKEYFNEEIISYKSGVKNLMLLIDVIGFDPVMKMVFSGDSEQFENLLRENLSAEDYNLLISYFKDESLCIGHNQENIKIRLILCNLYQSLYHKDIHDDTNISYDTIYKDNKTKCNDVKKYYLNTRKFTNLQLGINNRTL